jgi:hypothetical protein
MLEHPRLPAIPVSMMSLADVKAAMAFLKREWPDAGFAMEAAKQLLANSGAVLCAPGPLGRGFLVA